MVFSSVGFLIYFLPLFLIFYVLLPFRNATALVFSTAFYIWGEGYFVALLLVSVLINFGAGTLISRSEGFARQRFMLLGVAANLSLLFYFKYVGFLLFDTLGIGTIAFLESQHLPLGISFFSFQAISYLVDVYRREAEAADTIWQLALYIMMFPQLIAGPIVRYATVATQLRSRNVDLEKVRSGLQFFAIGLAQKVLIANNMAVVADEVFALSPERISTLLAWVGPSAYTLQIYFDFAGYSNMAIGLGLVMGFRFPRNFNYPYISQSITEFWQRWHMSLSSWFRDYLYIPLGGNRGGALRTYRNLFVVFLLCGLWHGAAWTFVFWGLFHGIALAIERVGFSRALRKAPRWMAHLYTMLVVLVGWVLFRAESLEAALQIFLRMLGFGDSSAVVEESIFEIVTNQHIFFALLGVLASTPLLERAVRPLLVLPQLDRAVGNERPGRAKRTMGWIMVLVLMGLSVIFIASGTYNPFIYFRF